jgi:hypothetical protein
MKLEVLDIFSKNTQISNFMKIRPVGAELFHANGRTDMTKLTVASRNFANAPKNFFHNVCLCVVCDACNKYGLFPCTVSTGWTL